MDHDAQPRLLLVDDDRLLCEMLSEYLAGEGFAVSSVHDGRAALERLADGEWDIVVLDVTMPRLDGLATLRELRRSSEVPVVMLTARGDDVDRIVGLEVGADDYLPKPFNPRELSARLRAVLRRSAEPAASAAACLRSDDLQLDTARRTLTRDGVAIALTEAEYRLVETLLSRAGSVVDKAELSRLVLGRSWRPFDRSLDTHLSNLRRKLGEAPDGQPRIRTLRGRGYLWRGASLPVRGRG